MATTPIYTLSLHDALPIYAARFGAAVDPGMIGALLDQDIAGLEVDFGVIEKHVDLTLHDDGVIDRQRAVHQRVPRRHARSEEHTSELQSRPHLVCRLLLEK